MSVVHAGQVQNQVTLEEHDGANNAKRVSIVSGAVGNATVAISSAATIFAVVNTGAAGQASVVLDNSLAKIGFATIFPATAWPDPKAYIGLVTVGGIGTITLADPKGFIGLVTAINVNGGSNKTYIPFPITLSTGSVATIAVPTNKFKITSLLISSNATVRINIKSGVTYLTGNASLGINLNPGGGFVKFGSPDAPAYIGLANAAALVIEKADSSGNIAQIGGDVMYFDEV